MQLWNRSLVDNLRYGVHGGLAQSIGWVIEQTELLKLIETLPGGMQTALGEGGALVSGGEGQRIRLGRAMVRPGIRLVILDEPFRGLDRERRRQLLARVRKLWSGATLLCITHDVRETLPFDRVLVIESGRIVEDSASHSGEKPVSRYRAMLEAEDAVRRPWSSETWRRLWLEGGRLTEKHDCRGSTGALLLAGLPPRRSAALVARINGLASPTGTPVASESIATHNGEKLEQWIDAAAARWV